MAKEIKKTVKKKNPSIKTSKEFLKPKITVIGIGGGGCSIVSEIAQKIKGVNFIAANTDLQALKQISKKVKIFHFGKELTNGLGCGMDPQIGKRAAENSKEKILNLLNGNDLIILISCLGGGAGSGAVPVFIDIAKQAEPSRQYFTNQENNATLGIFTLPFKFEGPKRNQIAKKCIKNIFSDFNALAVIPNQRIFQLIDKETPFKKAFSIINKKIDDDLSGLIEGIFLSGLINIDFADVRTILEGKEKLAFLNSIVSEGANKSDELAEKVLQNPLHEYNISGAERILFNITSSKDLGTNEVEKISKSIFNSNKKAKIIFGVSQKDNYKNKIKLTLLAVGPSNEKPKRKPRKTKQKIEKIIKKIVKKPVVKKLVKKNSKVSKSKKTTPKKQNVSVNKKQVIKKKTPVKKVIKKKISISKKKIIKKQTPTPSLIKKSTNAKKTIRKNALELRKDLEKVEKEILENESRWDVPAFLREKK